MRGAKALCRLQVFARAGRHAAFTLHRLENHRADFRAVRREFRFERRDVVVAQMRDAGRTGSEAGRIFRLAARRDGEESVRPWNAFSVDTTRARCGPERLCAYRRASFSAASFASAPELQKKTRSANVASVSRFARRNAGSLVNQYDTCHSVRACVSTAFTIAG